MTAAASLIVLGLALGGAAGDAVPRRPNVLVILTDDQGWGDLSVHGNTNLRTPHVDSLARDGALFERFFVCPVCSPTRAEFLTGRYHPRAGVSSTSTGGERLDLDEKTIGDAFTAAGYAVGAFGKWHNGSQYPYHPNGRGFAEFYGFCSGHWAGYFSPPLEHNGKPVRGNGYIADDCTDRALAFMAKNRERPFFCYLPFNTPHTPAQVPAAYFERFAQADLKLRGGAKENLALTRATLAMCENIDANVGRLLRRLDELRLADDTIVLFFCDNGPNGVRWNGGMKGVKGSTDEGGVRAPLLVRWPKGVRPGVKVPSIAGAIDLLPTLAELTGVRVAGDKALDGVSLAPLLRRPGDNWPDRMIFSHWNGNVSVRTQQYRLDAAGKLYDLTKDPGQAQDVADQQPETAQRLRTAVARWKKDVLGELKKDERPFPVGFKEFPVTVLPARDGVPHGNVRRSAPAPNCSYFTNWTSPDDRITWDVEVAAAGRYQAAIHYTCAAADVGSVVELSLGAVRLDGKVSLAHDPPRTAAQPDRVPRRLESDMKEFAELPLGVVTLPAGRGRLTLRAPQVAGKQVMDVRSVVLTLLP